MLLVQKQQIDKMSYFALFFNAPCLRYSEIFCRWFATAKSTEYCNCLIISDRIKIQSIKTLFFTL